MSVTGDAKNRQLTLMLVVGEPSGDVIGAQLMAALKELAGPRLSIIGVGGSAMTAQGLHSIFPLDDTAVMGLREVVPRIPKILRRVQDAIALALKTRPDLVVLIDSPDFTHRIAMGLKSRDPSIRTANYAAPQVWASRQYRAKKMARYFDMALTLLPFEAPFFEKHGLHAKFVGYPVLERAKHIKGGDEFRSRHGVAQDTPLLAVLPGSRRSEIRFILPEFKEAVRLLARNIPNLQCVLPTIPHVAYAVKKVVADWPTPIIVTESDEEKYASFDAADVALAASGTVTSEVALSHTPMVVGYKVGWLTWHLSKRLILVPYITLINLILNRQAVPEFLQEKCTPQNLAAALKPLLTDEKARATQVADLEIALKALGEGDEPPSRRAARAVLELAEKR